jgi:signal transduction histidine kinase
VTLSIRTRLTLWYAALAVCILTMLGAGVLLAASWGLRRAADQELDAGIKGVATFLQHKLDIHEMNDLNDELREHSALLPRNKMFRVSYAGGALIYQPDAMSALPSIVPLSDSVSGKSIWFNYRTLSRFAHVGPYGFLIEVAVDQTEYMKLTQGLAWLLLLSVPFAGLLAALAGYWMSGRALAPIEQITATANSIDAATIGRRLPLRNTGDELDRLSATINQMLDRIASSYGRVAQFTADASHELRTPVALIRTSSEVMLMDPNLTEIVRQGLTDLLAESTYMTRLIADLLVLARTGVDDASIPMELLELNESTAALLERVRGQAARRGITLECNMSSELAPVFGHQDMVERILIILVDNALCYTLAGGTVRVAVVVTAEHCGFVVEDTGIGIEPVHYGHIFERFFRVDRARTPRDGGSGLGLSIAKNLVDLHAGTIDVSSKVGQGSTFTVTFPRADLSPAAATRAVPSSFSSSLRINSGSSVY